MTGGVTELLDLVVTQQIRVAKGVAIIDFAAVDGGELPAWTPGAHLELELPNGMVRHYSFCGTPGDRAVFRVAVLREHAGRGGSAYIHDQLQVGDIVKARVPRNRFELQPAARYLFVAGGIGITPLIPMMEESTHSKVPWKLIYGGGSPDSMAFLDHELLTTGDVDIWPAEERGFPPFSELLAESPEDVAIYACGPVGMINAVREVAEMRNLEFHRELFSVDAETIDHDQDHAFDIVLRNSGKTVRVAADESILAAVEREGVTVYQDCLEGTCGSCETRVLAGAVEHRDFILTPDEEAAGDVMMICVSRCLDEGPLELDL